MQALFVSLIVLVSFGETFIRGERTNVRSKHLFVQRRTPLRGSSLPHREIYLSEDDNGSTKHSLEESRSSRAKRSAREKRSKDPVDTLHEFNDNHHMLIVQWTGFNFSDTVVVLTRDITPDSDSTSYLYVSNNYGKSYTNQSHKLHYTKDGVTKHALIEKYYTSPINSKWYIFVDTTNNVLFTSKDDCKTLKTVKVNFKPTDITFHSSRYNGLVAYDDTTQTLYYSKNFGTTWSYREKNVRSYFWGFETLDSDNVIYLELDNGHNTSDVKRVHYDHKHLYATPILTNVTDFEISDVYLFATRKSKNGLDLYVGYHYHDIEKAEFPNELRTEAFLIADASESQVFVAVNHDKNTSHLYISDTSGKKYTLSLERVLYFNPNPNDDFWLRRYVTETFVDLYPVVGMRGVYLASQLSFGKVGTRKIYTVISYDKGRYWSRVNSPIRHANGSLVNCSIWDSCSLHLAQHFASVHPWYYAPSVMSKKSAPGLIVSSGNIGERLTRNANLYVSNDAGDSWLEALEGRWFFNFGDHGGVIVAVRQWSPTKELLYSTDEGLTWKRYNFTDKHIRVYGLLTEPGEKTTTFTLFGSYRGFHSWLVVQVDVKNILGRACTDQDYETWTPYNRGRGYGCILGQRFEYERRKRLATCYNGRNYDRPKNRTICRCTGQDFECDVGFQEWWVFFCRRDPHASFNPYAPPRPCLRGTTYNRTQGYRKISGDVCSGGSELWFQSYETSCPFEVDSAFLMYAERSTIKYMDLTNSNHSIAVEGLRGAVALAYDMRQGYIYWADMTDHKIMRRTLNATDEAITIAGIKQVEGMDFDWTTDNLYWVDAAEKVIEVCRKDGLFRKTIHSEDLEKPRALALDPALGEMFWSDWGTPAKIEMSDMDGTNRKVLIGKGIVWPNGLAIDIFRPMQSRVLYYTDASVDIIGSYDMTTKKHEILASKTSHNMWSSVLQHPYSIAVDNVNVYWDDWQSGKVYKIHKSFKGEPEVLIEKSDGTGQKKRYEIKVYYSRSQVDNSSCSGVSCSQLCLPKPNNIHNCTCGDDLELVGKECKCVGGLITLTNGTCKTPSGATCAPHEFTCRNGFCVPDDRRCDWEDDCGDFSDEDTDCHDFKECDSDEFRCPDERCIPRAYVCNGYDDCFDKSDEAGCEDRNTCSPRQFRCNNGQCIPKNAKCDGDYDCNDKSDEKKCPTSKVPECPKPSDFMCDDQSGCVSKFARCNNISNCRDNSDETDCVSSCRFVNTQFMCQDRSQCIDIKLVCNGVKNCLFDGSDEWCATTIPPTRPTTIPPTRPTTTRNPPKASTKTPKITTPRTATPKTEPTAYTGNSTAPTGDSNHTDSNHTAIAGKQKTEDDNGSKKTLMWAIPVGIVFAVLLGALVFFVVKSRKLQRSFYHLVRSDSFDHGVQYHNVGDGDDTPLIQGFSDDDPLVEA